MAKWLFMGVMNPDEIKHELYSTKVMEYREELKEVRSVGRSSGSSHGHQSGGSAGAGFGGTRSFQGDDTSGDASSVSESASDFSASSESESESFSESTSESVSYVPTIVPVLGKELSHVQFRSLEEQLFRSMAVLFDQKQRFGVARLVGMNAPVSLYTPTVATNPGTPERVKNYIKLCCEKLPFALPMAEAQKRLAARALNLPDTLVNQFDDAPIAAKRRIR